MLRSPLHSALFTLGFMLASLIVLVLITHPVQAQIVFSNGTVHSEQAGDIPVVTFDYVDVVEGAEGYTEFKNGGAGITCDTTATSNYVVDRSTDDNCFAPGDVPAGITITPVLSAAEEAGTQHAMVYAADESTRWASAVYWFNNIYVVGHRLTFESDAVTAVGLDVYAYFANNANVGEALQVTVKGAGDTVVYDETIDLSSNDDSVPRSFFGIVSDVPISEVTLVDAVGGFFDGGNVYAIDNVAFGTGAQSVTLEGPADGEGGASRTPSFAWSEFGGAETYTVRIFAVEEADTASANVSQPVADVVYEQDGITETQFQMPANVLDAGTSYSWQVASVVSGETTAYTAPRTFTTAAPTAAEDPSSGMAKLQLTIAPNPARGPVRIRLAGGSGGPAQIQVFDVLGRAVATLSGASLQERSFTVPDLAAGAYVVRVEADGHVETRLISVTE